ncbi:hypothetical protein H7J50_24835 [Mycobacterium intermedium]|nr:hypothetical protein [Mycobacterium intermedium]
MAMCAASHVYIVVALFSNNIFWLTYYVADYDSGFVRRGLGGELIDLIPVENYFTAAHTVLWSSVGAWLIAVGVLMRHILHKGARSERRVMLALLAPVLPFSLSYAVFTPHPELFGMAALLLFTISLTKLHGHRCRVLACALYGLTMAVLALLHEAIPLALSLGATLAIIVLVKDATRAQRRLCAALAVAPGVVSVLVVAVLGRRDIAAKLCAQIPHGRLDNPWAVATTPQRALDYMLGRIESSSDYHDWACENAIPIFDADTSAAVHFVMQFGPARLLGSFSLGMLFFAATLGLIRVCSAVPLGIFVSDLRSHRVLPMLSGSLLVPLFATGADWTRWWILITFDVAGVYLLAAIDRPEIERRPRARTTKVFGWVIVALAFLPTGAANNLGG